MPPALSDDENSETEEVELPVRANRKSTSTSKSPAANAAKIGNGTLAASEEEEEEEEEDDGEEGEDDEDLEDDVFVVEAIKKHMVDEDGTVKFQVKWEGWDKKSDLTWEPVENLRESAKEILEAYFEKIGGEDSILEQTESAAKGKKRGRQSTGAASTTTASKRSRKSAGHPGDSTPPATLKKWSPPAGSWEDDIETIDACEDEGTGRGLVVYLIWKNGQKTKHDTSVIYKKCPQKMLQFYERHVRIVKGD